MPSRNAPIAAALAALLLLGPAGCKKSPTTATVPAGITAAVNPTTASVDTPVSFTITITGNTKEIKGFGGEVTFDAKMFQFKEAVAGSLTGSWASVAGNENSPGVITLGGFPGGGTSIAANSSGTLVEVRFKVTGADYGNGQQSQTCLGQFADDLTQFTAGSACATFTLKK
jgi:hypothetical protein